MKQYAALIFFFFLAVASHSQKIHQTNEVSLSFEFASYSKPADQKNKPPKDYLTTSKNQRKAARILLIGGATLIATSLIIPRGELEYDGICIGIYCDDKYQNDGLITAFFIAGSISMLGSIPLYIASNRNKRKAMSTSASLKMGNTPLIHHSGISRIYYPTASIKISF